MKFTVGQVIYTKNRHDRGGLRKTTVTKIGHKWVHLQSGQRINPNVLPLRATDAKGNYSESVYFSEEEYTNMVALSEAWSDFRKKVSYGSTPLGLTVEDIESAKKLLKLD